MLVRSIVDVSVASPERLVFEGAPEIVPPLQQETAAREAKAVPGRMLDSRTLADLTLAEAAEFRRLIEDAKLQVEAEAEATRERHVAGIARKIAEKRGIPLLAAQSIVRSRYAGELHVDDELIFDDPTIGTIDVRDVLLHPEDFDGLTLADPIEGIDYGPGKAKVFYDPGRGVRIHSFAHGGFVYRLRHDAATVKAAIDAAGEHARMVWMDILYESKLEEDVMGMGQVLEHVADKLGIGKRDAANAWQAHKKRRDREEALRRRRERIAELRAGRAVMDEPSLKDERTAVVTAVEQVLVDSARSDPVFRDGGGVPARVECRTSPLLHLLTSATANAEISGNGHGGPAADDPPRTLDFFLPPPPMPLVTPYQPVGLQMRIEEELMVADARGERRDAAAGLRPRRDGKQHAQAPDTGRHLRRPAAPAEPRAHCRRRVRPAVRVLLHLHPRAGPSDDPSRLGARGRRAGLPVPCRGPARRRAHRRTGKAVIIAALCTLVLGAAVAEKPIFFVVANQRGTGKTTIAHIDILGRLRPAGRGHALGARGGGAAQGVLRHHARGAPALPGRQHPARAEDQRPHARAGGDLGDPDRSGAGREPQRDGGAAAVLPDRQQRPAGGRYRQPIAGHRPPGADGVTGEPAVRPSRHLRLRHPAPERYHPPGLHHRARQPGPGQPRDTDHAVQGVAPHGWIGGGERGRAAPGSGSRSRSCSTSTTARTRR